MCDINLKHKLFFSMICDIVQGVRDNNLPVADVNIMNAPLKFAWIQIKRDVMLIFFMLIPALICCFFLKPARYWENICVLVTKIIILQAR